MRIDSPKMTNAEVTGSFKGSFSGSFEGDIQADSVQYANVLSKPTLLSGSAQIASDISGSFDSLSGSLASRIATHESSNTGDVTLNTSAGPDYLTISGQEISVGTIDISADTNFAVSDTTGQTGVDLTLTDDTLSATLAGLDTTDSPTFAALSVNGAITVTGNVDGRDLSTDGTKLDNIEENADVTDTANVTAAGALMDSEVTSLSGIKTLTVPDSTTISSFGASLVDDADASAARTTLGVDAAGTDNSTDVTLVTTSHNYLSLSGQAITLGQIDISDDTNLAVSDTTGQTGINLTLSGDSLSGVVSGLTTTSNVTFASLTTTGNTTVEGNLVVEGTTQTVNTETLSVEDNMIYLNSGSNVTNPDLGFAGNYNDGTYAHAGLFSDASDSHTFKFYKGYTPEPDAASHIDTTHASFTLADLEAAGITANGNITVTGTVDGRDVAADGSKLDGIADEANAYVHPTHPGDDFSVDTGALTGATVVSDIDINVTTDALGHVTDANGSVATRTLTLADLGYTGTTDANTYVHPTHPGDDAAVDTGALTGATVISDLDFNITTDNLGHVTDANATVATRNLTLADLGYTGATNANYITNNNQLTNGAGYITSYVNTTYSAGTGLDLSGTTFSIEPDLRDSITYIGYDSTDYIQWSNNAWTRTVVNGTERLRVDTSGIDVSGRIVADGDITAYSDEKLKKDVSTIENALDKTKALRGVEFTRIADESRSIGVIAQELEKVLPELVSTDEEGMKAVNYGQITGLLIEAVKELSAKVEELENK